MCKLSMARSAPAAAASMAWKGAFLQMPGSFTRELLPRVNRVPTKELRSSILIKKYQLFAFATLLLRRTGVKLPVTFGKM